MWCAPGGREGEGHWQRYRRGGPDRMHETHLRGPAESPAGVVLPLPPQPPAPPPPMRSAEYPGEGRKVTVPSSMGSLVAFSSAASSSTASPTCRCCTQGRPGWGVGGGPALCACFCNRCRCAQPACQRCATGAGCCDKQAAGRGRGHCRRRLRRTPCTRGPCWRPPAQPPLTFVRTTSGLAALKEKACACCRRSPSGSVKVAVHVSEWLPCVAQGAGDSGADAWQGCVQCGAGMRCG